APATAATAPPAAEPAPAQAAKQAPTQQRPAQQRPASGRPAPSFGSGDGVQRYGESVVREILGATFIEEQPHNPSPRATMRDGQG
ncbi:MAG TPA: hypothetical protein VIP54_04230, partial [Microterricola sp.]